jgi:hypothetical protein
MTRHESPFRLIAVDGQPLPVRVRIGGADYLVDGGDLEFDEQPRVEPPSDGAVRWRLFGTHPDGHHDRVFSQREPYRRIAAHSFEFSTRSPLPEYSASIVGGELVLSSRGRAPDTGVLYVFGRDHEWRFAAQKGGAGSAAA